MAGSSYGFQVRTINGRDTPLAEWQGKVRLLVNVASACGFTPQYAGLQLQPVVEEQLALAAAT